MKSCNGSKECTTGYLTVVQTVNCKRFLLVFFLLFCDFDIWIVFILFCFGFYFRSLRIRHQLVFLPSIAPHTRTLNIPGELPLPLPMPLPRLTVAAATSWQSCSPVDSTSGITQPAAPHCHGPHCAEVSSGCLAMFRFASLCCASLPPLLRCTSWLQAPLLLCSQLELAL